MLTPCFRNPRYISPAPGIREQQKVKNLLFFLVIWRYLPIKKFYGKRIYGIGNSTEAAYYLDTGVVECLLVADEFNLGYQSLNEIAKELDDYLYHMQSIEVYHTIIRKEELFSEENQEILFTMSQ